METMKLTALITALATDFNSDPDMYIGDRLDEIVDVYINAELGEDYPFEHICEALNGGMHDVTTSDNWFYAIEEELENHRDELETGQ